ncbi:TetR/AcrR family transcriptional regulator [Williamsia sp.]|uniref:TetR/AcrR family transcriptional regulator n=1 Tax=Williamsia sp. TaxID=1872085 RepID=UPI001A2240C3|nr:TetR/AcrR family transcriptional regulator [Williamsia sp.]MBJ7290511.1 TetR/AcrR family transcriptional regulator [Williamsia sp.]
MAVKSRPDPARSIVDALLDVVAEHGLERATVREVAATAGVAIGTVQHYFPTKDAMVVGAFTEVVARIRRRVDAVPLSDDVESDLRAVLGELLPVDARRQTEARIQLAFAARAAVSPTLAALQREVLDDVRASLALAFERRSGRRDPRRGHDAAAAALALVDGLAMHAVSAGGQTDVDALRRPLDLMLAALLT